MGKNILIISILLLILIIGCRHTENVPDTKVTETQTPSLEDNNDLTDEGSDEGKTNQEEITPVLPRVKGKSNGVLPYAPVDESNVVARVVDHRGGALETTLANGMKMYVIIPEDTIITGASADISILPYKEIPTGEKHFALTNELGYGAQVMIGSIQRGINVYVVFDTTGKAVDNIDKKIIRNRCDPRQIWFNPVICAGRNKVPANKLVDKEFAIVSPIHTERYNELILPRNTIPLGVEGLLVAEVKNGDVFIPLKLDKALAANFAKQIGKYGNDVENLEAAALALEWGIPISKNQADNLVDAINSVESYSGVKQAALVEKKVANYAVALTLASSADENTAEDWALVSSDLKESTISRVNDFYDEIISDSGGLGGGIETTEGASTLGDLADANVPGADAAADDVANNLQDGIESGSPDANKASDVVDAGEAIDNLNGFDTTGLTEQTGEAIDNLDSNRIKQNLQKSIENVYNDAEASISDLLNAAALAQALGLDDLADKILDRIKKRIEDEAKKDLSKSGLYNLAGVAQALGMDNLAGALLDRAKKKADEECNALVKKNLANFGINECK